MSEPITKVGMTPCHPGEFIREEILNELHLPARGHAVNAPDLFILERYQATDSAVVADPKASLTRAAISPLLSGVVRINCLAMRPTAPRAV